MNIEEVKRLRAKLAADITELIAAFQKQTGCSVARIGIEHLFTDADAQPVITKAEVQIALP